MFLLTMNCYLAALALAAEVILIEPLPVPEELHSKSIIYDARAPISADIIRRTLASSSGSGFYGLLPASAPAGDPAPSSKNCSAGGLSSLPLSLTHESHGALRQTAAETVRITRGWLQQQQEWPPAADGLSGGGYDHSTRRSPGAFGPQSLFPSSDNWEVALGYVATRDVSVRKSASQVPGEEGSVTSFHKDTPTVLGFLSFVSIAGWLGGEPTDLKPGRLSLLSSESDWFASDDLAAFRQWVVVHAVKGWTLPLEWEENVCQPPGSVGPVGRWELMLLEDESYDKYTGCTIGEQSSFIGSKKVFFETLRDRVKELELGREERLRKWAEQGDFVVFNVWYGIVEVEESPSAFLGNCGGRSGETTKEFPCDVEEDSELVASTSDCTSFPPARSLFLYDRQTTTKIHENGSFVPFSEIPAFPTSEGIPLPSVFSGRDGGGVLFSAVDCFHRGSNVTNSELSGDGPNAAGISREVRGAAFSGRMLNATIFAREEESRASSFLYHLSRGLKEELCRVGESKNNWLASRTEVRKCWADVQRAIDWVRGEWSKIMLRRQEEGIFVEEVAPGASGGSPLTKPFLETLLHGLRKYS